MKNFFSTLPSALLILLFVYAAASKLAAFGTFRVQLHLQPVPEGVADVLLYLLPAAELIAVGLLFFKRTVLAGLELSLALLLLFTCYIALAMLHYWSRTPCACGGILSHMTWRVHLVFNSFFIALNLIAIKIHLKERGAVTG